MHSLIWPVLRRWHLDRSMRTVEVAHLVWDVFRHREVASTVRMGRRRRVLETVGDAQSTPGDCPSGKPRYCSCLQTITDLHILFYFVHRCSRAVPATPPGGSGKEDRSLQKGEAVPQKICRTYAVFWHKFNIIIIKCSSQMSNYTEQKFCMVSLMADQSLGTQFPVMYFTGSSFQIQLRSKFFWNIR